MLKKFSLTVFLLLTANVLCAQDFPDLQNLKRPRYGVTPQQMEPDKPAVTKDDNSQSKAETNSRFAGTFKGEVTVHYIDKMIRTAAALTIATGAEENKNHYDFYIIPAKGNFLSSKWEIDKSKVLRTTTISGDTIYITDIIEYQNGGGNSQIRTLVFSEDHSALTFLKTEFDDASRNSATGQIIGRFVRSE